MKFVCLILLQLSLGLFAENINLQIAGLNQLEKENDDTGELVYKVTGIDPFIVFKNFPEKYDPDKLCVLSFEYQSLQDIDGVLSYFGPPLSEKQVTSSISLLASPKWKQGSINFKATSSTWKYSSQFRIDLGSRIGQKFKIRNFKLREFNKSEKEDLARVQLELKEDKGRKQIILESLNAVYPVKIDSVKVNSDTITISGTKPEGAWFDLVEVPVFVGPLEWQSYHRGKLLSVEKSFKVSIPRYHGKRDKLYSRWAVCQDKKRVSHFRYADEILGARKLKKLIPTSKKGTQASWRPNMMNDLVELGVKNLTMNVLINGLIQLIPNKNTEEYQFNGETFHINKGLKNELDRILNFAKENEIVVTAILLMRNKQQGREKEIWEHPDCESGAHYAMPNINSEEGVKYYTVALDFLANRYSREDNKYGRISNWIIHNEVDVGVVWTNAGDKLMESYTDLYYRSMRIAHLTTRKYDPHARVFASFTHYWTKTVNPRYHLPKNMLQLLMKMSKKEGDFDWGIAYHPYPKNLRDPVAWKDQNSTFSFNTPLITFSNLEVLDAWVKKEENRYKGKVRGVLLSEQGLNSPDYSEKSLHNQAAGFAYFWSKVKNLDSIEAFQYHRWVDHAREGGLLLGLWTLKPGTVIQPDKKKPIWDVFRAAGTSDEAKVFEKYKAAVGVKEWSEVEYKKPILD